MSVRLALHVEGVNLNDDATVEAIATHLSDVLWYSVDGTVRAEIETMDPVTDAVNLARRILCQLPGSRARRVHRDLVSASDIASRTGFSREAVRKWANGSVKFPQPLDTVGAGSTATRVWLWSEVSTWARARYAIDVEDDGPGEAVAAEIDAYLHRVPSLSGFWQPLPEPTAEHKQVVVRMSAPRPAPLRIVSAGLLDQGAAHPVEAGDMFHASA